MALEYESVGSFQAAGGLRPVVISSDTTTDGATVDTKNFSSLTWVIEAGVITDGDYQVLLEESDTDFTGETTVADADIIGGVIADWDFAFAADDATIVRIGVIAKKRFQRCSLVSTGTTSGGVFSWHGVQGHSRSEPAAEQKTA
jgi:hypothetical protein